MPTEDKKEEKKSNRFERFMYTADDVKHIFRLDKIGTIFTKNDAGAKNTVMLKKMLPK